MRRRFPVGLRIDSNPWQEIHPTVKYFSYESLNIYLRVAAVAIALGLVIFALVLSRRKSAEEKERERRDLISKGGRITDGTVIDISEITSAGKGNAFFLFYRYQVAGVSYEASQDVTSLNHLQLNLSKYRIGLPASVKYDPQNPVNSIIVAENWSGLRA